MLILSFEQSEPIGVRWFTCFAEHILETDVMSMVATYHTKTRAIAAVVVDRSVAPQHSEPSHPIAGVFVAVFERELGDAGFVELAQTFGDHAVVLFLGRARER